MVKETKPYHFIIPKGFSLYKNSSIIYQTHVILHFYEKVQYFHRCQFLLLTLLVSPSFGLQLPHKILRKSKTVVKSILLLIYNPSCYLRNYEGSNFILRQHPVDSLHFEVRHRFYSKAHNYLYTLELARLGNLASKEEVPKSLWLHVFGLHYNSEPFDFHFLRFFPVFADN